MQNPVLMCVRDGTRDLAKSIARFLRLVLEIRRGREARLPPSANFML